MTRSLPSPLLEELSLAIEDGNLTQRRTPIGVNNDKSQAVMLLQSSGLQVMMPLHPDCDNGTGWITV